MEMMELSNEYLNSLAQQLIFISAFLGGFSATILGTLIVSDNRSKYFRIMVVSSALAAMCFVVTLFGMTSIIFQTTDGYPLAVDTPGLVVIRLIAIFTMLIGLISFTVCIASSGWLISKKIGRFTTAIGVIAFILIVLMS